jgi:hypothetical protein
VDFVVVGLGLGACAVLAGVILLGWSLPRAEGIVAAASDPDAIARGDAAVAATRGAGQVMLSAGGAIFLATAGALAGSLDDRTGAFLVVTTVTVAALGILVWGYRNRNRIPWLMPRRGERAVPAPATVASPAILAVPIPEPNGAHEPVGVEVGANGAGHDTLDREATGNDADDPFAAGTPASDGGGADAREEVATGVPTAWAGTDG